MRNRTHQALRPNNWFRCSDLDQSDSPLWVWDSSKKARSSLFVCSISPASRKRSESKRSCRRILIVTLSDTGGSSRPDLYRAPLFSPVLPVFWPIRLWSEMKPHETACETTYTYNQIKTITKASPLHRMALLSPRASAVPELIFSTSRCLTFFSTETRKTRVYTTAWDKRCCDSWRMPSTIHTEWVSVGQVEELPISRDFPCLGSACSLL